MPNTDPVALTAALIRCPSVTPEDGGTMAVLEELLGLPIQVQEFALVEVSLL